MSAPVIAGKWQHYATLHAHGQTVTVTRRVEEGVNLCIVTHNGALRAPVLGTWADAMRFAASLLTSGGPRV